MQCSFSCLQTLFPFYFALFAPRFVPQILLFAGLVICKGNTWLAIINRTGSVAKLRGKSWDVCSANGMLSDRIIVAFAT